jgi:hypothetical protein
LVFLEILKGNGVPWNAKRFFVFLEILKLVKLAYHYLFFWCSSWW